MKRAVEDYYTKVLRCSRDSKGARCPGEDVCVNDPIKGVISQRAGETLETYCKEGVCPLFWSKPGNIPVSLISAINTCEDLQEDRLIGIVPSDELTAWEIAAFKAASKARQTVENEPTDESKSSHTGSSRQDLANATAQNVGDKTGIQW